MTGSERSTLSPLLHRKLRMSSMPRRALSAWRIRSRSHPAEWADEHLWMPPVGGGGPVKYLCASHPFQRGVWDALDDDKIEVIVLWWATQVGKTTLLMGFTVYLCDQAPCPIQFSGPTEASMRRLSSTRLQPMFDASEKTSRLLVAQEKRHDLRLIARRNVIHFGWSGAPVTLGEVSAPVVLMTELDKWSHDVSREADPENLAGERVKSFGRFKIVKEGTSTVLDQSRIVRAFERTDQRKYFVPCPHCGVYQVLEFEQIKCETKDPAVARETSWYECLSCKGRIMDAHKPAMLAAGQWRTTSGKASPRQAGFHLSSLYAPSITFGRVMEVYLESRHDAGALQNFWNSWLARAWAVQGSRPRHQAIESCRSDYSRGTVPDGVRLIVGGADVQADRVYWILRGFGENFESWLIDYGVCGRPSELVSVAAQYSPRMFLLDTQYIPGDVLDFITAAGAPFVAVHGVGEGSLPVSVTTLDIHPYTGKRLPEGTVRYNVNSPHFKSWVHGALRRAEAQEAGNQPRPEYSPWHLPCDVGSEYIHHLQGEALVKREKPRTRRVYYEWVILHANHYLDCEVYATGGAWTFQHVLRAKPKPRKASAVNVQNASRRGPIRRH